MKYLLLGEVSWDELLPGDLASAWKKYHYELPVLASLYLTQLITHYYARYKLHGLSDSSKAAYARAVYLRIETNDDVSFCTN